jgi:hypothetical protein
MVKLAVKLDPARTVPFSKTTFLLGKMARLRGRFPNFFHRFSMRFGTVLTWLKSVGFLFDLGADSVHLRRVEQVSVPFVWKSGAPTL